MLVTLSFALWLIGLFLVLKYRVHIHVNIETKPRVHPISKIPQKSPASQSQSDNERTPEVQQAHKEIETALAGLGCKKAKARQIAKRVCSQPGSFDDLLRAAIREAA